MLVHRLRKLARLSRAELGDLAAAQAALLWAQLLVWTRPTGRLLATGGASAGAAPASTGTVLAHRCAGAIERAAKHGVFRPACLVRSVALNRMLEGRGVHGSQVRIGVRWDGSRFAAHAWVEYEGRIIGDRARHVRQYTQLSDVQVLAKP